MRRLFIGLAVAGLVAWAAPAFAQSSSGGNAGGSSTTGGSSKSSLRVRTSGGAAVGVSQGNVASGSRARGCNGGDCKGQDGSAISGAAGAGQAAGVSAPANAVQDGVVNNASLPALELGESQSAADRRPSVLIWAIAAAIIAGMIILYRRLPRPTPAS